MRKEIATHISDPLFLLLFRFIFLCVFFACAFFSFWFSFILVVGILDQGPGGSVAYAVEKPFRPRPMRGLANAQKVLSQAQSTGIVCKNVAGSERWEMGEVS